MKINLEINTTVTGPENDQKYTGYIGLMRAIYVPHELEREYSILDGKNDFKSTIELFEEISHKGLDTNAMTIKELKQFALENGFAKHPTGGWGRIENGLRVNLSLLDYLYVEDTTRKDLVYMVMDILSLNLGISNQKELEGFNPYNYGWHCFKRPKLVASLSDIVHIICGTYIVNSIEHSNMNPIKSIK